MKTYLVLVEGSAHDVSSEGQPVWTFSVRRRVTATSEAEAKSAAIGLVAREWASGTRRGYGAQPGLRVIELREAGRIEAWWRGRGTFVFHKPHVAQLGAPADGAAERRR